MEIHKPTVENIAPGVAEHDQCCAVNWRAPAVLNVDRGVFEPSWAAQGEGWRLIHANTRWKRFLLRWLE